MVRRSGGQVATPHLPVTRLCLTEGAGGVHCTSKNTRLGGNLDRRGTSKRSFAQGNICPHGFLISGLVFWGAPFSFFPPFFLVFVLHHRFPRWPRRGHHASSFADCDPSHPSVGVPRDTTSASCGEVVSFGDEQLVSWRSDGSRSDLM